MCGMWSVSSESVEILLYLSMMWQRNIWTENYFRLVKTFWAKKPSGQAWEKSLDSLGSYACYVAYTVLASRAPIEKLLHETEMWKVYTEIELPLVFTLDSMEKWGICVRGEELKNYGEKLSIRIHELEKLICEHCQVKNSILIPRSNWV